MAFEQFSPAATAAPQENGLNGGDILMGQQGKGPQQARPAGTTEGGGPGTGTGTNGGTEGGGGKGGKTVNNNNNDNTNTNNNSNTSKSIANSSAFSFGGVGGGFCTENVGVGASFLGIGGGGERSKVDYKCLNLLQTQQNHELDLHQQQFKLDLNFKTLQETDVNANARASNLNVDRKTSCDAASNLANSATSQYSEILVAGQQTRTNGYADSVAKSLAPSATYLAGKSLVAADACVPNSPPPIEIPPITAVTIAPPPEAPKPHVVTAHKVVHHAKVVHPCDTDKK